MLPVAMTKAKPKILGHSTARRVLTPSGWLYETRENQALAVQCELFLGASLPELDDFIERMEADHLLVGTKLRKYRQRALAACTSGDQDSLEERIQLIAVNSSWQKRESYLLPLARKGERFSGGRAKGAISKQTKHIFKLAKDNLSLSAKELFVIANKSIIGDMSERTFSDHLTGARRIYPKKKKSAN
jgi:hypothetical protein